MSKSIFQPKWRGRGISSLKRFQMIEPYVKSKSVLDIGCAVGYLRPNWIHDLISKVASKTTGIDIDLRSVQDIKARHPHLDVFPGDACSFDLNQQFDVVHAGELIEHIDNFSGFFSSVKKHLTDGGFLLLSTPNVECINHPIYNLTGGLKVNQEHVCWFCDKTLKTLLNRNGFEVLEMKYFNQPTYGIRKLFRAMLNILPNRLAYPTLFVIARPIR